MEVFKLSNANLIVYLHPSKAGNIPQGIQYELGKLLFKFNEVFDGDVLSYIGNVVGTNAKILPTIHPYYGVRLKAKLLLFSPKPEMLIEGKVMKLGEELIHVVLGFCSAAISEVDIRKDFRYKIKHGEEVYASTSQRRHVIKVGSMIRFLVKSMDEYMLHISGSLLPPNTGSIKWLDKEEGSESARRVKKRKGESHKGMQVQGIGFFGEEPLQNNEGSSKKAKRR